MRIVQKVNKGSNLGILKNSRAEWINISTPNHTIVYCITSKTNKNIKDRDISHLKRMTVLLMAYLSFATLDAIW